MVRYIKLWGQLKADVEKTVCKSQVQRSQFFLIFCYYEVTHASVQYLNQWELNLRISKPQGVQRSTTNLKQRNLYRIDRHLAGIPIALS